MRTYWNPLDRAHLLARIQAVQSDSPSRWGRMDAHQMLCHLADAFRVATGAKDAQLRLFGLERPVKWLALYVPAPWPHGYPAPREINQTKGVATPPKIFDDDRRILLTLMTDFTPGVVRERRHPLWGRMSEWEWGRWGYLHTDHHLRQFGH